MIRLIELLISMVIVAAVFLLVAIVLPSSRHLEETVETNRRMTIVYDTLNSFHRFKDWSPLALRDPKIQLEKSGPEAGKGARLQYTSTVDSIGSGAYEITDSVPGEHVAMSIDNQARGTNKRTEFKLEHTGRNNRNVKITQTYDVDYGWNLLGRYAGLYVSSNVGDDMQLGLTRLVSMLASVPNVDYRMEGSTLTDLKMDQRPAEDLLVVNAGAVMRDNDAIMQSMKQNMEWINRAIVANNLEAAGPMRIITTELSRDTYTFDVAVPVRRKGATPDAASAAMTDLKLSSPVTYLRNEPSRVATARFTGHMAGLENVRNALRAWAMTQGQSLTDRPYEIYTGGIDKAFSQDGVGEYQVIWAAQG